MEGNSGAIVKASAQAEIANLDNTNAADFSYEVYNLRHMYTVDGCSLGPELDLALLLALLYRSPGGGDS